MPNRLRVRVREKPVRHIGRSAFRRSALRPLRIELPFSGLARLIRGPIGGFTPQGLPLFVDLCREAVGNLLNSILNNSHHVLHHLLPPPSQASQHYSMRSRRHHLQLSVTPTSLIDRNFIPRMLQKDSY